MPVLLERVADDILGCESLRGGQGGRARAFMEEVAEEGDACGGLSSAICKQKEEMEVSEVIAMGWGEAGRRTSRTMSP